MPCALTDLPTPPPNTQTQIVLLCVTWVIICAPKHVRRRPRNILWLLVPNAVAVGLWVPSTMLAAHQLDLLDRTLEKESFLVFVLAVFGLNL